MKRWLTLFPDAENLHLIKDVGMIPYILHKHYGYQTTLACYKNGEYPYLQNEVKGLRLQFVPHYFRHSLFNLLWYIIRHGRHFDVLQMYHYDRKTLYCLSLYKLVTLFKGKTYLKLDADEQAKAFRYVGFNGWIAKCLVRWIDLLSAESQALCYFMNEQQLYKRPVVYIPNGFYYTHLSEVPFSNRKPLILTVGRIGTHQKATEVLLEAFANITTQAPEWNLALAGPVEAEFKRYLSEFFQRYPLLRNRIVLHGNIQDRQTLHHLYQQARFFVLPSRYESFGFVCLEAVHAGCYLIASDLSPIRDITNEGRNASLFTPADVDELTSVLSALIHTPKETLAYQVKQAQTYIKQHFYWPEICDQIIGELGLSP